MGLANPGTDQDTQRLRAFLEQVDTRALLYPIIKAELTRGLPPGLLADRYELTYRQVHYIGEQMGIYPRHLSGVE